VAPLVGQTKARLGTTLGDIVNDDLGLYPAINKVTTELGVQLAWKHRRADAVYTTPAPLVALPGTEGGARRIGNQYKSETRWQASEHWQWQLQLAWMDAGPALKQAGGQDTLFASIVGAWQW